MRPELKKLVPYVAKPVLSKIHSFKGVYKGQSCYIFGDGISIKWFDLNNFTDKPVIPMYCLPFHNQSECLHVDYALLTTPYWFYPIRRTTKYPFKRIRHVIQRTYREKVIAAHPEITFFGNISSYPVLRKKNVQFVFRDIYDKRLSHDFLSRRVDCFTGSLRFSILLAIYLGCDCAFLVGCDYTHSPARVHHWYEKGLGNVEDVRYQDYQREFFKIAQEFIDLTTITLDGKSTFLNHVTYEEHTGVKPNVKENHELVDKEILKILSTWPGYTIY